MRLYAFARRKVEQWFDPLEPGDQDYVSEGLVPREAVEGWLESTSYTQSRKEELLATYDKICVDFTKVNKKCKSFVKEESYPNYKFFRQINSRSDESKVLTGPMFQRMADRMMHFEVNGYMPFIKFIPHKDRPAYIMRVLRPEGRVAYTSDFTSFEALFVKEIMEIEIIAYKYLISRMPETFQTFMGRIFDETLAGRNVCEMRQFIMSVMATRMSGEMCTSLGNGFANLVIHYFVFEELLGAQDFRIVVEGDDALMTCSNVIEDPTPYYNELGLIVKLEQHQNINTASFCGCVFDTDDMVNVTDPRDVLLNFGWASAKYIGCRKSKMMSLLRAKSLSYLHQYPGCPVIQSLALYGLRVTSGISLSFALNNKNVSMWEREQLQAAQRALEAGLLDPKLPARDVPMNTRLLVEDLYGITYTMQLSLEAYLDGLSGLTPLRLDRWIDPDPDWVHYYDNYMVTSLGRHDYWVDRWDAPAFANTAEELTT